MGGVQTCAGDNVMALDDVSKLGGFKNHNTEKPQSQLPATIYLLTECKP